MLKFEKIMEIRRMYYGDHVAVTDIAEKTGSSVNTIKKYLDITDFSISPTLPISDEVICPKLERWKPLIDLWLTKDLNMPRKQRHTALRVYERLREADTDFNCSYRTVCTYVRYMRNELGQAKDDGHLPLVHSPGECQGDFGEAVFIENGIRKTGKFFVLDFPYSNCGFAQLKYGENMECLLESMDAIFKYIGGVPPVIWFDNASTMVSEVMRGGGRKLTERFLRFLEHYHIRAVFMNPDAGNEKGGVESKVGYIRRHMLVPVPEFEDLSSFNEHFFQLQEDDLERCHYRKNRLISDLFLEDMKELLPLPAEQFELAQYKKFKTDPTGLFTIDSKYTYSSSPEYREKHVLVKMTSMNITVLNHAGKEVTRQARLYGENAQISIDWIPYLKAIARKPRSFFNTGFSALLPEEMRLYLFQCENTERGKILGIMSEMADSCGFEEVLKLVRIAVSNHAMDAENFEILYRRYCLHTPVFKAPKLSGNIPEMPAMKRDLSLYNRLLNRKKDEEE